MQRPAFLAALVLSVASSLLAGACTSAPREAVAHEGVMERAVDGQRLAYLLRVPGGAAPEEGWPLLLFLHGAGERGDDLDDVQVHGPPRLVDEVPELGRCVLVAPQCPTGAWWRSSTLLALLDEVQASEPIDPSRLYVTGLSMGGYGTWNLLAAAPARFAAAVPICGGGEIGRRRSELATGFRLENLLRARDVPIRAFHGGEDEVIPPEESERLVAALQAAGADATLTIYPGVGHDAWTRTYADPDLYAWLFAQHRTDAHVAPAESPR